MSRIGEWNAVCAEKDAQIERLIVRLRAAEAVVALAREAALALRMECAWDMGPLWQALAAYDALGTEGASGA